MVKLRDTNAGSADQGERLASLDATRGIVLLLFVSGGFGLRVMLPGARWGWITGQWTHRDWFGCSLWDLLQPALLFIAGVALSYSYTNRQALGQNWFRQFGHALLRSAILIALGIYLDSYQANRLLWWEVRGDLQLIGLAYLLAFLVVPLGVAVQSITVGFLLIGHIAAFVIYGIATGQDFWLPDQNVGIVVDRWLRLGAHPRHLATLNGIPATALVLLGTLFAGLVRGGLTPGAKVAVMTLCSLTCILLGWVLSGGNGWIDASWFTVVPMIPRLMTFTFVLTAVGWTLLLFTYFYLVMDGLQLQSWGTPLSLMGRNSLLLFLTFTLAQGWAVRSASLILPASWTLRPLFVTLIVIAMFWLLCFFLYRRRIFVKV
ncbi:MAG: hypothetical protein HYX68_26625 [Planctomycetes bacterium]|nr:hypothetical protein [Planctomycetota bacterium]